jgi:hypothetical protein
MNIKVTITYIVTEDEWEELTDALNECSGINSDEAQELVKNALLEDPLYVLRNSTYSIKQDFNSI